MLGDIFTGGLYGPLCYAQNPIIARQQQIYANITTNRFMQTNHPLFGSLNSSNEKPDSIENDFDLYIKGCEETIEKDSQKAT